MICQSFGCTPDVAAGLDPRLVFPILDYRLAESAKEMQNSRQADKMSEGQATILMHLAEGLKERDG